MSHPSSVDKAAFDAWNRECTKPGSHWWEQTVGPIYAAHYRALHTKSSEVPVFTPQWVREHSQLSFNDFADAINDRLNAVRLSPASEPELDEMAAESYQRGHKQGWFDCAKQSDLRESDLEKIKKALQKAAVAFCSGKDGQVLTVNNFVEHGAKYLAAEGLRPSHAPHANADICAWCRQLGHAVLDCPRLQKDEDRVQALIDMASAMKEAFFARKMEK